MTPRPCAALPRSPRAMCALRNKLPLQHRHLPDRGKGAQVNAHRAEQGPPPAVRVDAPIIDVPSTAWRHDSRIGTTCCRTTRPRCEPAKEILVPLFEQFAHGRSFPARGQRMARGSARPKTGATRQSMMQAAFTDKGRCHSGLGATDGADQKFFNTKRVVVCSKDA